MPTAPSLFVSHGSPMFAVEPGPAGAALGRLGQALAGVDAVLVVSPHWQSSGLRVGGAGQPETIHDFGGFPPQLYALRYPAPGAPALAVDVVARLREAGLHAVVDADRGLDHGAWVPMLHLRPAADLPVLQVSMPRDLGVAGALALGRALAPLRSRGVMLVGSGSLTHNLYEVRQSVRDPEYAREFADWVAGALARDDLDALRDYRRRAPHATRAHPTEEHFLPLLVALGASDPGEHAMRIDGGIVEQVLSMDAFGFGLPAAFDASTAR